MFSIRPLFQKAKVFFSPQPSSGDKGSDVQTYPQEMRPFKLEPRHFLYGLTSRDFEDYVGAPVTVLNLADPDFQFWEKLSNGAPLSDEEIHDRKIAIFNKCQQNTALAEGSSSDDLLNRCKSLAIEKSPIMKASKKTLPKSFDIPWRDFDYIQKHGLEELDRLTPYMAAGHKRYAVFPEPRRLLKRRLQSNGNPLTMILPIDCDPKKMWSLSTGFSSENIYSIPPETFLPIEVALHEMRHIIQVFPKFAGMEHYKYYYEFDSTLFARNTLRRTGKATEYLEARLKAHYINMVFSPERYWFAPALETIENGRATLDYWKVVNAHNKVMSVLYADSENPEETSKGFSKDPQKLFACLQKAIQDPDVKKDPLSTHIALRIKDAVDYFCPQAKQAPPHFGERFSSSQPTA